MLQQVLSYIRRHGLMRAGDRVGVAVSGGADSVALLRALLELRGELGVVLSVVHFNHKIRGAEAEEDEEFVRRLAAGIELRATAQEPGRGRPGSTPGGLSFYRGEGDTPAYAREHKLGLEAAARKLRYGFFRELIRSGKLDRVASAHTLTDQAETVLLRLIRGAGTRGLAGVHRSLAVRDESGNRRGAIVRPLLEISRAEVERYLRDIGQEWREDASNRDISFARNRIRHELLPLLRRDYNPAMDRVLAETAEIARAEEEYWEECVARVFDPSGPGSETRATQVVSLQAFSRQPLAMRRRLVRAAAAQLGGVLDFDHVEQVLTLLAPAAKERRVQLPALEVTRNGRELRFARRRLNKGDVCASEAGVPSSKSKAPAGYEHWLSLPGEVFIREIGRAFRASYLAGGAENAGYNECQLEPATLPPRLCIRNWRAGDRFWPAHTKSPKKVKVLLQERRILQPEKALWPVVEGGGEIVWIPGFAPAAKYLARSGTTPVVLIEEVAWGAGDASS